MATCCGCRLFVKAFLVTYVLPPDVMPRMFGRSLVVYNSVAAEAPAASVVVVLLHWTAEMDSSSSEEKTNLFAEKQPFDKLPAVLPDN